ncbi:MAG: ATP-binding protein [Burkholderiaceae bacterium]
MTDTESNLPWGARPGARALVMIAALAVIVVAALIAGRFAERAALASLARESDRALELIVTNLEGALARYEALPRILALDPRFDRFLQQGAPDDEAEGVNQLLLQVNQVMGALDTYLLDRTGLTVAASNWRGEKPFIGQNFSYRPYFQEAMQGRAGRFFALGTTSNRRGYYFAFPVMADGVPQGAIVVKAPVEHLESHWASGGRQVVVLDENGVVFLSSRPDWWFRALAPLDRLARLRLADTRRYGDEPIETVPVRRDEIAAIGSVWRLAGVDREGATWLARPTEMREAGWTVVLLSDTRPATAARLWAMALTALIGAGAALVTALLFERRARIRRETLAAEQARALLERRVAERTEALAQVNAQLRRTRADALRQERMAAIGQVSAGIGHELTQPLTAIHSYVQNAHGFLARGQLDKVGANLEQIDRLSSRIAEVVRHLKSIVRGDPLALAPVDAHALLQDVIEDVRSAPSDGQPRIVVVSQQGGPIVRATEIALRQVFTNLLSNALDALRGRAGGELRIVVSTGDGRAYWQFDDNGPGFGEADPESVFDAFFTTKSVDRGLGLGLAIVRTSLNRMGGSIHAARGTDGGASFRLWLPLAGDVHP